jgi:enolase-phosphatase E1
MNHQPVKYILTDIEGTTTAVSFVYDTLFPFFREHISRLTALQSNEEVIQAVEETKSILLEESADKSTAWEDILATWYGWSVADMKITPLKTVQGILWADGYHQGLIKGHIYADVPHAFQTWRTRGITLGIFSSGSVAAQKLLFGFSEAGDLTTHISDYFDTKTGGKREVETYTKIAQAVQFQPNEILFLSDICEELEAAKQAGLQTIQLVRPGTDSKWERTVSTFDEITL